MGKAFYTLSIEDQMLILVDSGRGVSVTNAAEDVVTELWDLLGADMAGKRIIYRDTEMRWDGMAHRGRVFLGFVHLGLMDRAQAIDAALAHTLWPT